MVGTFPRRRVARLRNGSHRGASSLNGTTPAVIKFQQREQGKSSAAQGREIRCRACAGCKDFPPYPRHASPAFEMVRIHHRASWLVNAM
jgi:hypothetical protein